MRSEEEANRAIERYADTVRRICMVHLKNYADTEDIFQTVFLKYVLYSEPFENEEHEKAWIIPVIGRLFPEYREDTAILGKIALNLSANLLGLGNAATPLGLAAIQAMAERNPSRETPTRGMVLFVVMNTASLQLIPLNMAAMRQSAGSAQPFAILPAVWITSAASLAVCLAACKLLERSPLWQR